MRLNYFENIAVIVNTLQVICQDVWDGFLIVDPRDNVFITCGDTFRVLNVGTKIVV